MTLKAVVVMNNSAFDEGDATKMLQDFVKANLPPYKYPREIKFIDELPKTGTGKIDRRALLRIWRFGGRQRTYICNRRCGVSWHYRSPLVFEETLPLSSARHADCVPRHHFAFSPRAFQFSLLMRVDR